MDNRLFFLLQWCDSNFPSGGFSHSFGLETYVQEERVSNRETFFQWLLAYLEKQLLFADGLAHRLAYEALEENKVDVLWKLDQLLFVQNAPSEPREASRRMGERMIRMGMDLYPNFSLIKTYFERIQRKQAYGHPAIVFAILTFHFQVEKEQSLESFLYTNLASLVQNGVRAIPLGQTDGQRILVDLNSYILQSVKRIIASDQEDFGIVSPGLEVAQMRHERLHVRLFMS